MSEHPKFAEISVAINAGMKNLDKWYNKIDDTNVYFICLGGRSSYSRTILLTDKSLALDPKWKLAYTRAKWDEEYFNAGVEELENVVMYSHCTYLAHNPDLFLV